MSKTAILIITITFLLLLIPISISSYNSIMENYQTNLGYELLKKYKWNNTQFTDSREILIAKEQIKDYPTLSHGLSASQKIGFDYGNHANLKVNLLAYKLNKQYAEKQLYAHILVKGTKVVGAYVTTEFTNDNDNYYFSLDDTNLEQPIY